MTLMDTILRRKPVEPVEPVEMITMAEHDEALREARAEIAAAKYELGSLLGDIWRAEFQKTAPDWKPLPDLVGMISQIDNMYAGVRGQRDKARFELNEVNRRRLAPLMAANAARKEAAAAKRKVKTA